MSRRHATLHAARWRAGGFASRRVEEGLSRAGFVARIRAEGDRLYIGYEPLFEETGFVRPEVMVEFGARSTGEPRKSMRVLCDIAAYLPI